jgi:hypothetical protein
MSKTEIFILILVFMVGAMFFWISSGYFSDWDAERLRRMLILRLGFSFTIGCAFVSIYCALRVLLGDL